MPPDKVRPPGGEAGGRGDKQQRAASGRSGVAILDDTIDNALLPRWTGCPAGCPLDHHECDAGTPVRTSCHACGALSVAERESLTTCWSVCPMRAGAS